MDRIELFESVNQNSSNWRLVVEEGELDVNVPQSAVVASMDPPANLHKRNLGDKIKAFPDGMIVAKRSC